MVFSPKIIQTCSTTKQTHSNPKLKPTTLKRWNPPRWNAETHHSNPKIQQPKTETHFDPRARKTHSDPRWYAPMLIRPNAETHHADMTHSEPRAITTLIHEQAQPRIVSAMVREFQWRRWEGWWIGESLWWGWWESEERKEIEKELNKEREEILF